MTKEKLYDIIDQIDAMGSVWAVNEIESLPISKQDLINILESCTEYGLPGNTVLEVMEAYDKKYGTNEWIITDKQSVGLGYDHKVVTNTRTLETKVIPSELVDDWIDDMNKTKEQ